MGIRCLVGCGVRDPLFCGKSRTVGAGLMEALSESLEDQEKDHAASSQLFKIPGRLNTVSSFSACPESRDGAW